VGDIYLCGNPCAPIKVPSRADVKLTGYADKTDSAATVSGGFEGWYEI